MKIKKLLSILVALCMIMQILPVFAEDAVTEVVPAPAGVIFSDTFDDGTACGWVAGAGNAVTITPETLETGESVIKVEMPKITASPTWVANNAQSSIMKEANVPFTGDNLIKIQARVKNAAANDKYLIRVNRPNATSSGVPLHDSMFNTYMVSGYNGTAPIYGLGVSDSSNVTNGYKNVAALLNEDGTAFDYTGVDFADKWIDYTVVINGATNEQTVTATFEHNGETVTLYSGPGSTFLQTDTVYSWAGRSEEKTFEAFERLTFSSYDSADDAVLYIDSVSVENIVPETISAEVLNTTITPSGSVFVQFEGEFSELPEGAVVVENAEVTQSFDNDTKTLTITPVDKLTAGTTYNITFDEAVLAENYLKLAEGTDLAFTTTGYAFNDNFDDATAQGWVAGAGNAVTITPETLTTGEKVIKVEMPKITASPAWAANNAQSSITKAANIKFTGENLVKIQARVKNAAANDKYLIRVNRPNATSQGVPLHDSMFNTYMVSGYNGTAPLYGLGVANSGGVTNGYKNVAALLNEDGTAFDYTGVDFADKWIDYTVVINGATNEQTVTATFEHNGETVTLYSGSGSTFLQPDTTYSIAGRTEQKTFEAFERLTFSSYDSADDAVLYIDSVSVENFVVQDVEFAYTGSGVVKNGDRLTFDVTTYAETVPTDAVKINGKATEASYDADTKVLTVTAANIVAGNNTVTFDTEKLASAGLNNAGESTFTVTGLGYVINDNFDDATAQGWVAGAGNAVTITPETLATGESVIKVEMPKITASPTWAANNAQSSITKAANIKFTGDNLIKIKARVKNAAANDKYLIRVNRPNATSSGVPLHDSMFNTYMVAGLTDGVLRYGNGISNSGGVTNSYKNAAALLNEDGSAFDYTTVNLADKWIDYTIIINGATNEQTVTATFENNGETVTLYSGSGSTFLQPDTVYSIAGRSAEKTFEGFERLTFSSYDSTDDAVLYIDSVSVENFVVQDVEFAYTGNGVVKNGDALTFDVTTYAETVPADAVKINGKAAEASYDAETKVLTVTAANIVAGNNAVVFDTKALADNGFNVTGESTFTVTGTGFVINDNFDDSTVQGWESGKGKTVTLTAETLATGEKVLKAEMPVINMAATWAANGELSTVTKAAGIKFTGDNLVRIKARVKNDAANDAYLIKVNRPNATSQGIPLRTAVFNMYMVTGLYSGQPMYGQSVATSAGVTNSYKNMAALPLKADGSTFDYTNVDLTGKWIDYTVVINGATNQQWVTATFENNGETVTLHSGSYATFVQTDPAYSLAGRAAEKTFEGFERLTFASRDSADSATIYIDSVSVENIVPATITAEYTTEKLIDTTDSVAVKFTGDITSIPEGAVTVAGAQVTQTFNPETKVLTITPVTAFEAGKGYAVTLSSSIFAANGITVEGETTFNFATVGMALNDDFNDGTTQGWTAGKGGSATLEAVTLETGEKVLKADLGVSGYGVAWANLYESNIFKDISAIPFTEDNVVRIKAKVKNASDYLIKVNRPDASGYGILPLYSSSYNHWMVAGKSDGAPVYGGPLDSNNNGTNIYKGVVKFARKENGAMVDISAIDFSDKWIEYTVVINGATNEQTVTATFEHEGETYTLVSGEKSTFIQPDGAYTSLGLEEMKFNALERLTFSSRDFSAASTMYIDSVSVETVRINPSPEAATSFLINNEVNLNGFKNGDVVKAKFNLNAKGVEKTYTLISAMYVDGSLEDIHVNYVTTEGATTYTEETGFNVNAEDLSKVEIKAFVWATSNGLGTLKPVCNVNSIQPNLTGED